LHNFCTADVRRLPVGRGCEAFVTTVQGKVLDFVVLFAGPESLTLSAGPGAGAKLAAHLDKYLIREQVEIVDRSNQWAELAVVGPQAGEILERLGVSRLPEGPWGELPAELAGRPVRLRRISEFSAPGYALVAAAGDLGPLGAALTTAGACEAPEAALDILRVEAGYPAFGRDLSDQNLPQEIDRDDRAISFTKGCYLGQETVARIDAMGHVNRKLCGLRFAGREVPPPGLRLQRQGQPVAQVTSAAWSPRLAAPIALGYVRRGANEPGTTLDSTAGPATVEALPFWP
jgi:hypothetical protein